MTKQFSNVRDRHLTIFSWKYQDTVQVKRSIFPQKIISDSLIEITCGGINLCTLENQWMRILNYWNIQIADPVKSARRFLLVSRDQFGMIISVEHMQRRAVVLIP